MEVEEAQPTVTQNQVEEAQPGVTQNSKKDEDNEEDLDFEEYSEKTNELFDRIITNMDMVAQFVNKIETALVTNITSDLSIMKALVVEFCTQKYMKAHVRGKVTCIEKEVDELIKHLKKKRNKKKEEAPEGNGKEKEEALEGNGKEKEEAVEGNGKEKEVKKKTEEERKLVKTSEWLYCIGKKTEKIKNLVSQFGSLPEEEESGAASSSSSSTTGGKREKQKTVSNSTECYKMCIEERLLISPIITGTLKKSYDHLPPNLKLCVLTLAAFPEDFIIKKRPLIYWWMAEGFVVANNGNSKSAEEVGEENFTQLIQLGLIQPWYESGNTTTHLEPHKHNNVHVQGCSVHPWIRRMLVPIAMEARLFEFFGIPPENPPLTTTGNPRSRRVCLYDDGDGEGVDHTATWKTRNRKYHKLSEDRFKWIKAWYNRVKQGVDKELLLQMPKDIKEVSKRQNKLMKSVKFLTDLNILVAEVSRGKVKHGSDDDDALLVAVNKRLTDLKARIDDAMKNNNDVGNNINEFHDEQMKVQNEIEGLHKQFQVHHQMDYLYRVLDPNCVSDPVVYDRINNCETLQKNEEVLFGHNDLNNPFPYPMKKKNKRTTTSNQNEQAKKSDDAMSNDEAAAERLLAIINVTQKYLDMEHEAFGKMKYLRTLHFGRWRDSLPVPHIEVENDRIFEALFHVAKHLKYLSLRGISRITTLPSTISKCCNLQILDLKACYNLETLPSEIASLYKLTHLDVSECYLLQNTNLLSLVQYLQHLQTLKGLKVDQSSLWPIQFLAASGTLRKLSIILTTTNFNIDLLDSLRNLHILTITWRITTVEKPTQGGTTGGAASTDNPPNQQPRNTNDGGSTETTPQPKPEKSDEGDANTESTPQPQPKPGGGASTENPPNQQPESTNDGGSTEITPQQKQEKSDDGGGATSTQPQQNPPQKIEVKGSIEKALPNLKKLDLRCYPNKTWPNWVKNHSSLETLYITGGDLEEFPMLDLDLQKLQLLRFKYLTKLKLGQDNTPQPKSTKFPFLITFLNHDSKPKK